MAFVVRKNLVPKRLLRMIEYHRNMGWLHVAKPFSQHLEEHVREGEHTSNRKPITAGERFPTFSCGSEHREKRTKDVGRSIHEKNMIALLQGAGRGDGGSGGRHAADLTLARLLRHSPDDSSRTRPALPAHYENLT